MDTVLVRHPHGEPSDLIRSVSRALRVLEAVGQHPRGLSVKQIARRCELTTATTYHLVRTLAYEGYVARREDGTYVVGLEVADRFRELAAALRGPVAVTEVLRGSAARSGLSHALGTFIGGQVVVINTAVGTDSPYLDELVPGFDEGAHATALGKALLATLTPDQRLRYLKDWGMHAYTHSTLTEPEALETDLLGGERRGMYVDISQYRVDVASGAVLVREDRDPERRLALACSCSPARMSETMPEIRNHLLGTARQIVAALADVDGPAGRGSAVY